MQLPTVVHMFPLSLHAYSPSSKNSGLDQAFIAEHLDPSGTSLTKLFFPIL